MLNSRFLRLTVPLRFCFSVCFATIETKCYEGRLKIQITKIRLLNRIFGFEIFKRILKDLFKFRVIRTINFLLRTNRFQNI
jgi:hypothetical protein